MAIHLDPDDYDDIYDSPDTDDTSDDDTSKPIAINVRQAAKLLGISERNLQERTRQKTVPHVRLEGRVLYSATHLRKWLKAQSKASIQGSN